MSGQTTVKAKMSKMLRAIKKKIPLGERDVEVNSPNPKSYYIYIYTPIRETRNTKHETRNTKHETRNPKPETLNPNAGPGKLLAATGVPEQRGALRRASLPVHI